MVSKKALKSLSNQVRYKNKKVTDKRKVLKNLTSEMTGKLENLESINTNPQNNKFCLYSCVFGYKDILKENNVKKFEDLTEDQKKSVVCYSLKMLTGPRKNCAPKWTKNHNLLTSHILTINELKTIKLKLDVIRFDAHGELDNITQLINYLNLVKLYPNKVFTLWTKRIPLINKIIKLGYNKPKNFFLIYSSNKYNESYNIGNLPSWFDKVFTVFKNEDKKNKKNSYDYRLKKDIKINCGTKKCIDCMLCYSKNKVKYINEIVK